MIPKHIKEIFTEIGDYIDAKLQTPTGQKTLMILAALAVGGSIAYSSKVAEEREELVINNAKLEVKNNILQTDLNTQIRNATSDCNEKIKESAQLHQELKDIYNNKIKENQNFVKEQKEVIKEKERVLSIQNDNINRLQDLNN